MEEVSKIAQKAAQGDSNSFEKLYLITQKGVWFTCISLLKNEENAKDIMQETYITAFSKLNTVTNFDKTQSWLNKIAANKCLNFIKSNSKYLSSEEDKEILENIPDDNLLPDDYITDIAKRKIIMDIIKNVLSEEQYQTVILYYFNNMTALEIAELMNCHEKTVRYRLNAAKLKIKEGVMKYEKENDDKLHIVMPIPFLTRLLKTESESISVPFKLPENKSLNNVSDKIQITKTKNIGGKIMFNSLKSKIIAGVCAGVIAVGGITTAVIVSKNSNNSPTSQSTAKSKSEKKKETDASKFEYELSDDSQSIEITKYIGEDSDVIIPEKIEGKPVTKVSGFDENEKLKSVYVPETVVEFGYSAFRECINLTEINIPSKVTVLDGTFWGDEKLETIQLPVGLEKLKDETFANCKSLKEIELPNTLKYISDYTFSTCSALKSVFIPKSVENLGMGAFSNCTNLTEVEFEDGIKPKTKIFAFDKCANLKTIILPDSLVSSAPELANLAYGNHAKFVCAKDSAAYKRIFEEFSQPEEVWAEK